MESGSRCRMGQGGGYGSCKDNASRRVNGCRKAADRGESEAAYPAIEDSAKVEALRAAWDTTYPKIKVI